MNEDVSKLRHAHQGGITYPKLTSGGRSVLTPVGAWSLARESPERLGEVVDVGEPALGRDLTHREAGVVEQVLGALYSQVQQELVRRPPEAVAEDLREPRGREPGPLCHVGDGQRFGEMQRHERGDPVQ